MVFVWEKGAFTVPDLLPLRGPWAHVGEPRDTARPAYKVASGCLVACLVLPLLAGGHPREGEAG